jgi:acyl-CoA reductase-like NAD-dependent aldehyde dehydrogenase
MDVVLVEYDSDGRVRLDEEDWSTPSLQERRAILHAAQSEIERLQDLVLALDSDAD